MVRGRKRHKKQQNNSGRDHQAPLGTGEQPGHSPDRKHERQIGVTRPAPDRNRPEVMSADPANLAGYQKGRSHCEQGKGDAAKPVCPIG